LFIYISLELTVYEWPWQRRDVTDQNDSLLHRLSPEKRAGQYTDAALEQRQLTTLVKSHLINAVFVLVVSNYTFYKAKLSIPFFSVFTKNSDLGYIGDPDFWAPILAMLTTVIYWVLKLRAAIDKN